jgi:hypothetical protein
MIGLCLKATGPRPRRRRARPPAGRAQGTRSRPTCHDQTRRLPETGPAQPTRHVRAHARRRRDTRPTARPEPTTPDPQPCPAHSDTLAPSMARIPTPPRHTQIARTPPRHLHVRCWPQAQGRACAPGYSRDEPDGDTDPQQGTARPPPRLPRGDIF